MTCKLRSLLSVYFVGVSIDAEEVLCWCEVDEVGLDEAIDDFAGVFLFLDLLVEVVEEVRLIGHCLIEIILESLHNKPCTFFNSFSGDFLLDSKLIVIMLLWYSFFKNS